MNPMNEVQISKATVSIGVGEAGEKLSRAITLLEQMFDQTPVKTFSKVTNPEFGIRKRQPIACKLTLRGEKADKAIEMVLEGINKNIKPTQFDDQGNLSFGIKEHIDIPGMKYNPDEEGCNEEIKRCLQALAVIEMDIEHMTGKEAIELTKRRK